MSFQLIRTLFLSVAIGLVLAGCGRRAVPAATETSTPPPAPAQPAVEAVRLTDGNLLTAPAAETACDGAPGAEIACSTGADGEEITVRSNAGVYARWRWSPQAVEEPLTGAETLALSVTVDGPLNPNLYLVEDDGDRMPVSLRRMGLSAGSNQLYLPLAEIRDESGSQPDFARINDVEIVFEWEDMEGTLTVHEVRFLPLWEEPVALSDHARDLAAALTVPEGFVVEPVADRLDGMTQVVFTDAGEMLVSRQNGRIWWYHDDDADGSFDRRHLYSAGSTEIVGLLHDPVDDAVWIGGRGQLIQLFDDDDNGVADRRVLRLDGLPWGRHQNNGLAWNPQPDPFSGEEELHWIYFGLGSTGDLEDGGPINSTILRFPRTGSSMEDLDVISRGNRNAYMVTWARVPTDFAEPDGPASWQLFASENGPDFNDAPDEVNHIRPGHHYGFPEQFGPVEPPAEDGDPYSGPIYPVTAHASASGLAYADNPAWPAQYRTLYVSLFGQVFSEEIVGHTVEGIRLTVVETAMGDTTYRGEPFDFVVGLDRPLPMASDPAGNLLVGDYATGVLYRIGYDAEAVR